MGLFTGRSKTGDLLERDGPGLTDSSSHSKVGNGGARRPPWSTDRLKDGPPWTNGVEAVGNFMSSKA
jgi:hypothetical protein